MCHHHDYLTANLSPNCPFRASSFFKDIPQDFRDIAKISYPWNSTKSSPRSTGIPPHVLLMAEMEGLKKAFEEMKSSMMADMRSEMDKRGVGGSEFHTNRILEALEATTAKMVEKINKAGGGERRDGEDWSGNEEDGADFIIMDEDCDGNDGEQRDGEAEMTVAEKTVVEKRKRQESEKMVKRRRLTMGYHHGRLQVLPSYWVFPNMTIRQLLENWFVGNAELKIPPYALLCNNHVAHITTEKNKNTGKVKLRQMRLTMMKVKEHAIAEDCWTENREKWTADYTAKMWEKVGEKYVYALYTKGRTVECSWKTVYNGIMRRKKEAAE
jgi:hypothetical protein